MIISGNINFANTQRNMQAVNKYFHLQPLQSGIFSINCDRLPVKLIRQTK